MPPDGRDATQLLGEAHHEIRALLKQTAASHGNRRTLACDHLRVTLAAHEAAEDIAIHPRSRSLVSHQCSLDRLAEERQLQNQMAVLERLAVDSEAFDRYLMTLTAYLDRHLVAEETYEFPGIEQIRDPREVAAMVRVLNAARFITSTTQSSGPNGGYSAMLQWAHDRLSRLMPSAPASPIATPAQYRPPARTREGMPAHRRAPLAAP